MTRSAVLWCVLAAAALPGQARRAGLRRVGPYADGRPIIMASLGGLSPQAYVEALLIRVAGSANVPVGLERRRDSGFHATDTRRSSSLLTGRSVDDALATVFDASAAMTYRGPDPAPPGRYAVKWTRGLAQISALGAAPTFLDRVIPAFRETDVTLVDAMASARAVARGDSDPHLAATVNRPQVPDRSMGPGNFSQKHVSVSLTRATLRDILNAVVIAHGHASWVVRYGRNLLDPREAVFLVMSFDGSTIPVS